MNRTRLLKDVVMTATRLSLDMTPDRRAKIFVSSLRYAQDDTGEDFTQIIDVLNDHHDYLTLRSILANDQAMGVQEKLRQWLLSGGPNFKVHDNHIYVTVGDLKRFVASQGIKFEQFFGRLKNEVDLYQYTDRGHPRYSRPFRHNGERLFFFGFPLEWVNSAE